MSVASIGWRRVLTGLIAVAFLGILAGVIVAAVPQTVGADHSYVVLSDSMSPSIDAGAVVFVSETSAEAIDRGDVITYTDQASGGTTITHRVVGIETQDGERLFRTQGDANANPDSTLVSAGAVVGVVQFHIPLIGYLIDFAGSTLGTVTLILIPAVLLGASELWSLYRDASSTEPEVES